MKLLQIAVPLGLAAGSYCLLDSGRWFAIVSEIMLALSILAAAVLFRLGRGLPPFAVEQLSGSRLRELSDAYGEVARRLAWMLALTALAIASLAISRLALTTEGSLEAWPVGRELMSASVLLSTLALVRAVPLVMGDIKLIRLQADLVQEEARLRWGRQAKALSDQANRDDAYETPKDYGGTIT